MVISSVTRQNRTRFPWAHAAIANARWVFPAQGVFTSCVHGDFWGGKDNDGGPAEAIRAPLADGSLVKLPQAVENGEGLLKATPSGSDPNR